MVKISRANRRSRQVCCKPSFLKSSFRNVFIFLVAIQCFRMMTMDKTKLSPPFGDETGNGKPLSHMGVRDQLADFQGGKPPPRVESDDSAAKASQSEDEKQNYQGADVSIENDPTEQPDKNADDEKTDPPDSNGDINADSKIRHEVESSLDLNPIVINKKGTGATSVGYVKDFVDERDHPADNDLDSHMTDLTSTIAKLINEKSVLSCYAKSNGSLNPRCQDKDTPLVAYNSESFIRTWCGHEIKPKSAVVMTEHCIDPIAHVFPTEVPPISGEHMPPIVIKTDADKQVNEVALESVECNIPCQQEKGFELVGIENRINDCYIDGEKWKIATSMDPGLSQKIDRIDYRKDRYYVTQSLMSSVPLTNFDSKIHSLRNRPMVDFDAAMEKAIYLVNDKCSTSSTKRNRWFDAVRQKITVDSYGSCGHNIEVPEGKSITSPEDRIALTKQYRIVLAFDGTTTKDHISDVVWEAFVSGAVPVVVGADNLRDRFPPNSFINVNDFNKWDELGDYVEKVLSDKELWLSFHKWRDDEHAIEAFETQYGFTRTNPTCRLCRWAYAKKYGLGWDHAKQEVRQVSKVPKDKFCTTADHGLVSKPFLEQWVMENAGENDEKILEEDLEGQTCSSLGTDGDIVVGSFKGHRKVFQHDGVTDFIITELFDGIPDSETTLRLGFPGVRNPDGACFYNTHLMVSTANGSKMSSTSIQDDLVKITILANWDTVVRSSGEGTMEVVIKNKNSVSKTENGGSALKRVRVIIEEVNHIHDKMTEFYPSSYCTLMMKDFINPVSIFFVDS